MSKLMIAHEHLDNAIKDLRKSLDYIEKRQFFVSEELLYKTIREMDALTVLSRKFI